MSGKSPRALLALKRVLRVLTIGSPVNRPTAGTASPAPRRCRRSRRGRRFRCGSRPFNIPVNATSASASSPLEHSCCRGCSTCTHSDSDRRTEARSHQGSLGAVVEALHVMQRRDEDGAAKRANAELEHAGRAAREREIDLRLDFLEQLGFRESAQELAPYISEQALDLPCLRNERAVYGDQNRVRLRRQDITLNDREHRPTLGFSRHSARLASSQSKM